MHGPGAPAEAVERGPSKLMPGDEAIARAREGLTREGGQDSMSDRIEIGGEIFEL